MNDNYLVHTSTFQKLGLCDWICRNVSALGYKHPTEIQNACIPAILQGKDVLACAETGSGKTAAFVLPMLQILSQDQYGIFGLILTPTRELALQIAEQVAALGATLGVTICQTIGGFNIIGQSLQLAKRPHFVVATPGRLRQLLQSADPPNFSRTKFLVLDEADRLLASGFSTELEIITSKFSNRRQTLLFSATFTSTLEELEKLALKESLRFDLTKERKIPTQLTQQYIFMPAKVKLCFLVAVLKKFLTLPEDEEAAAEEANKANDSNKKKKRKLRELTNNNNNKHNKHNKHNHNQKKTVYESSVIIFVETCHRCHEISEVLKELGFETAPLHSMLPQAGRLSSLNKFKNMTVPILVATDVASRGLDIPTVNLVINFDLPRISADYIHRIGRTARAGNEGQSISFITPNDIDLLHDIEETVHQKLSLYEQVTISHVEELLGPISKAMQTVRLNMLDGTFHEREMVFKKRKQIQRKHLQRKIKSKKEVTSASSSSSSAAASE